MSTDHVPRVTIEHRLRDRDSRESLRKSRGTTSKPHFLVWNVVVLKPFDEEEIGC
jgi:hypothetical protein